MPTTRKRKSSSPDDDDDDDDDAAKMLPVKKPTRPRRQPRRKVNVDENESFVHTKHSQKCPQASEAMVNTQTLADEVIRLANHHRQKQYATAIGGNAAGHLYEAKSQSRMSKLADLASAISQIKLLDAAHEAIQRFRSSINAYEVANGRATACEMPNWMRWQQDARDLGDLNGVTMSLAARIILAMVVPGSHPTLLVSKRIANDKEQMAHDLLEKTWPKEMEDTWGPTAVNVLNIMAPVEKILPWKRGTRQ
ncbi:hypothetical protein S40293_05400 [Stachybotrys chartarum IBT 40293]|nr:hypothetical protein S40293_05400 [Stachybotrys chartarum IBT 40293]